jgi:hypothetical protein
MHLNKRGRKGAMAKIAKNYWRNQISEILRISDDEWVKIRQSKARSEHPVEFFNVKPGGT